jgi:HPt (histidine-containing phosphotransfer) domain-containing protein
MNGYITKPVDEGQLLSSVAAHTGRGKRASPEAAPLAIAPADVSTLRDRYSSKPELLMKLVDTFRDTAAQDLARIESAIQTADASALQHAAHRLRGGAGFVCADGVGRLAGELERRAAEHQLGGLRELAERIGREITQSVQSLDRFVESIRDSAPVPSHSGKERES